MLSQSMMLSWWQSQRVTRSFIFLAYMYVLTIQYRGLSWYSFIAGCWTYTIKQVFTSILWSQFSAMVWFGMLIFNRLIKVNTWQGRNMANLALTYCCVVVMQIRDVLCFWLDSYGSDHKLLINYPWLKIDQKSKYFTRNCRHVGVSCNAVRCVGGWTSCFKQHTIRPQNRAHSETIVNSACHDGMKWMMAETLQAFNC